MEIKEFNYDNREDYFQIVRKYNKTRGFDILNKTNFTTKDKKIFLVLVNGIIQKNKIIGYAIIDENLRIIYLANDINEEYEKDNNTIYITDFMIRRIDRNRGIGKHLADYIINQIYVDKDIIS